MTPKQQKISSLETAKAATTILDTMSIRKSTIHIILNLIMKVIMNLITNTTSHIKNIHIMATIITTDLR
ncbi:hypothetical protein RB195_014545 [Necator americanus]|uniref:Uncharacterized protein n=1 Tax=Necator americanus TaxID=51031 RepID=A0ABR1E0N7_NECAM